MDQNPSSTGQSGMIERVAHHIERARALCTIACATMGVDGDDLRLFIEVISDELTHTHEALPGQDSPASRPDVGGVFDAIDNHLVQAGQ
jgi:hypothetical protein